MPIGTFIALKTCNTVKHAFPRNHVTAMNIHQYFICKRNNHNNHKKVNFIFHIPHMYEMPVTMLLRLSLGLNTHINDYYY